MFKVSLFKKITGKLPKCELVLCGEAPDVEQSSHRPKGVVISFNQFVFYTCNEGFKQDGDSTIKVKIIWNCLLINLFSFYVNYLLL